MRRDIHCPELRVQRKDPRDHLSVQPLHCIGLTVRGCHVLARPAENLAVKGFSPRQIGRCAIGPIGCAMGLEKRLGHLSVLRIRLHQLSCVQCWRIDLAQAVGLSITQSPELTAPATRPTLVIRNSSLPLPHTNPIVAAQPYPRNLYNAALHV